MRDCLKKQKEQVDLDKKGVKRVLLNRLMFLGPPLVGKGTQSSRLCREYNFPYLATGALFRKAVWEESDIGKKIGGMMNAGELIPDDITNDVVKDAFMKLDFKKGFVLDGYPRDLVQAEALEKMLSDLGEKLDMVVYIKAKPETLIERHKERLICGKCGATYNKSILAPKEQGICDKCGEAALTGRDDDNEEAIKKRLAAYYEKTLPLLDFYREKGILFEVEGELGADEVQRRIRLAIA